MLSERVGAVAGSERFNRSRVNYRHMEILLHSGLEHPNTLWIAVSAIIAFVFGVGVGTYRRALTSRFDETTDEAN